MLTLPQTLLGVGIATSLFCTLKKLISPKKMDSIPDPIPQQHFPTYHSCTRTPRQEYSLDACARMYCPNLVTISCYLNSVSQTIGLGFIVFDTGKSITVLGSSLFLYEYEETNGMSRKILRKGKVLVQIYGEQHEGEVVHIDFNLDVLIVTVKTSILCGSSAVLPRPLDVVSLPDCKVHCLIYIPFMGRFYPEVYELSNTKETRCGRSAHVVFSGGNFSGVVLQNGCIFGIKMRKCKFNEKLADVVLLHEMFEALSTIPSVVIHPCSDNASTSLSPLLNLQPSFDNLRMQTVPMLLPYQEQGQLEGSASEIVELVA